MGLKSNSLTLKVNYYVLSFQLDVGSDSESGAPNQGVSGPGQSNLSTEVAAALLIQREMASNRRRRSVEGFFSWRHLCKTHSYSFSECPKEEWKKIKALSPVQKQMFCMCVWSSEVSYFCLF